MKAVLKCGAIASLVILLSSCGGDSMRDFIHGTYISHTKGEYSVAFDTLVIGAIGTENNVYQIDRTTGYQRIEYGNTHPVKHETEQWTAVYDKQSSSMTETKTGKVLVFDPDRKLLLVGRREYRKIN